MKYKSSKDLKLISVLSAALFIFGLVASKDDLVLCSYISYVILIVADEILEALHNLVEQTQHPIKE